MVGEPASNDDYRVDLAYIGGQVRALRQERRWGVERLATRAGLHWTYVRQVEDGQRNLSVVTLFKLAGALGVDPCTLFPAGRRPGAGGGTRRDR